MQHITTIEALKAHLAEGKSVSRFSTDVSLESANLESANLESANLESANLESANLESADLYSANLRSANLYSANLRSANLYSANLESADLYSANLESANLRSANLYSANLESADLYSANLYSANLESADLYSAKLYSADLRNVTMNWQSHDLIAERLRQAAKDDVLLRLAAGYVLVSRDMCHRQLIANAPEIAHPEYGTVMQWALRQMMSWKQEDDGFPEILQQTYDKMIESEMK